jgi:hypothetical protein
MGTPLLIDQQAGSAFAADCRAFVHNNDRVAAAKLLEILAPGNVVDCRRHPLGFVFYDLGRDGDDRFHLHIWPEDERLAQDSRAMVHDHIFALESRVLVGCLVNRVYEVKPDPDGRCSMYEVTYSGVDSRTEQREGRYSAHEISSGEHAAFAHYQLAAEVFHRSDVNAATFCATIVVEKFPPPPRPLARVLAVDAEPLPSFDRAVVGAPAARSFILRAGSLLGNS